MTPSKRREFLKVWNYKSTYKTLWCDPKEKEINHERCFCRLL